MTNIEIYTKTTCPNCHRAKALIAHKGISFQEIAIDNNVDLHEEMKKRSGRTTVPQIFINGKYIGGYNDLYALDSCGRLDTLFK